MRGVECIIFNCYGHFCMKYNPQRVVDFNAPFLYLLLLHHTETMGSDEMDCSLFFIVNSSRPRL